MKEKSYFRAKKQLSIFICKNTAIDFRVLYITLNLCQTPLITLYTISEICVENKKQ